LADVPGISTFNPQAYAAALQDIKQKQPKKPAPKRAFFSLLEAEDDNARTVGRAASDNAADSITQLLDEVHSAGDSLIQHAVPDTILRYKNAVKSFITHIVRHGFTVEERTGILNRYKPQYKNKPDTERSKRINYTVITIIDTKLENLAAQLIAGQKKQLDLLARIDEINGLIVDLFR
jgi:uncharacterized protein YaaR (DUF327 family)